MRRALVFAGLSGAVMVAMGAYASHGALDEQARGWLQTGVQFGIWHSIALAAAASIGLRAPGRLLTASAMLFAVGILLFSGTLFARALLDWAWVSKATPLGGMSFIAGWLLLAAHGLRMGRG